MRFFKSIRKNRKKGFTLVELLISMVLVGIFTIMLSLISMVMMNNFNNNTKYIQASDISEEILQEFEVLLRKSNQIDFRTTQESLNDRDDLQSSDFSFGLGENDVPITQLHQYSAVFSTKGMVYKIKKNPANDYLTISNIDGIGVKSQMREIKNSFNELVKFEYKNNKYLEGFFLGQEKKYFPELKTKIKYDYYGAFNAVIYFTPLSTKSVKDANKYTFSTLKVEVELYDQDDSLVTSAEKIISLKNIEKNLPGSSYMINGHRPPDDIPLDSNVRYRILYYGLVYAQ